MNFPFFIARRYLFSKKSTHAINVISAISVVGVAVATMALVVTLSVFNGFHDMVASFFTSFDPQLKIVPVKGKTMASDDPLLAKVKATVPTMSNNWFFNVGGQFFDVANEKAAISQEVATGNGGGILEADPCAGSAEFNMVLTNADLKAGDVGDPRWNASSPNYVKKQ